MVGVSKTGTSVWVIFPSASSSVATIVTLTLGITASSLLTVLLDMVVTGTLPDTVSPVNGRCSAALAAATPLPGSVGRAVVTPRVNMVQGDGGLSCRQGLRGISSFLSTC